MQMFAIIADVERYKQLFDIESDKMTNDRFMELAFHGNRKSEKWTPPKLRWIVGEGIEGPEKETYDKTHAIPDIAHWYPGCLILNPKATEILKHSLSSEAEFLPALVEGEKWTILNVINMQDVLDKANCRYHIHSDGTVGRRIVRAAFFKDKIANGKLFKVVGRKTQMFTNNEPGSFKELVERNGLTGIFFDEY
jgi:hypothetical protein